MALVTHRDPLVVGTALAGWVAARTGAAHVRVTNAEHPSTGWSSETVLVDLAWAVDDHDEQHEYVVRLAPPMAGTFRDYDLAQQATAQLAAAAAGYGLWLVYEKDSAGLIGTAGLRPLDHLGLEIFYSLAPGSWGKGYATEAARAVLDHALGPLGLPEVLAEVDEGNTASIAVIERLGMTEFDVVPGLLGPMARYRKTA